MFSISEGEEINFYYLIHLKVGRALQELTLFPALARSPIEISAPCNFKFPNGLLFQSEISTQRFPTYFSDSLFISRVRGYEYQEDRYIY